MSDNNKSVAVIGAGIVGVSCALWLQRKGFEVVLLDRDGVAEGTSMGNAGILETSGIIPVTAPGILFQAPRMLFHPNEPLFLRWSYLPKMIPFLFRYLSQATQEKLERFAKNMTPLIYDSYEQHLELAKGTPAEDFLKPTDYLFVYDTESHYRAEKSQWELRRKLGHVFEEMSADDLTRHDPQLEGKFGFAVRTMNHGQITDPGAYTKALADIFVEKGGKFEAAEVLDFQKDGARVAALETSAGVIEAGHFVLAGGAWSNRILSKLGASVPLESERGYHIEFVDPSIELKSTLMLRQRKFAMNSMIGRLRCAGIVEFGGLDAPASKAPFELLKRNALSTFPDLEYSEIRKWMGHRPATSDSLPLIGSLRSYSNLWTAFGHQHLGVTAGPKTGLWLSQMISGERSNVDLEPYQPERFSI